MYLFLHINKTLFTVSENGKTESLHEDRSTVPETWSEISETSKKTRQVCKKNWKKEIRKFKRNHGISYVSVSGTNVKEKTVKPYVHNCRYNCAKFSEEQRQNIHKEFWKTGSWQLQTSFIRKSVTISKPKRAKKDTNKHKQKSSVISLEGQRVCKEFFLRTLDISNRRFTKAALETTMIEGLSPIDKRGRHPPSNKISEARINKVKEHINSFPRYRSHYSRNQNPNKRYLAPNLSITKMYQLYKIKCEEENITPVKPWIYRRIFNTDFNLSFYKLRSDTCNTCDKANVAIKSEKDTTKKKKLQIELEIHHRKVKQTLDEKKKDIEKIKNNNDIHMITFDLQKTLPTPCLKSNLAYYKRALWTYNLGIHNCQNGHAFMFMWPENIGSRGASEIGSCLLKYIKEYLPSGVRHLIAYSDSCGGQNRNKIIARIWLYIVAHTNITTIDHKFMISGHSYLPNDTDFAHIERKKKTIQYVYTPKEWMELVDSVRPQFQVIEMKSNDFFSTEIIGKVLINRKIDTEKQKINWLKMRWMQFKKAYPKRLFFKETLNPDIEFFEINLAPTYKSPPIPKTLPLLRNNDRYLKKEKLKDIKSLLEFVPPIHHRFYEDLQSLDISGAVKSRPRGRPISISKKKKEEDEESYPDDYNSDESY